MNKQPTDLLFEVDSVSKTSVRLTVVDERGDAVQTAVTFISLPASVALPPVGPLADARPGDRFRLVPVDD